MKIIIFCFLVLASFQVLGQDKLNAVKTTTAMTVDGLANEAVWAKCTWYTMDQAWLFTLPPASDFTGNYKVAWDQNYIYLLAEITDDIISDDHAAPLTQWYDDDCIEVFLDENRSKGTHQYNYNAFAYHVSLSYDVVDIGTDTAPHLYNDHITTMRTTVGNKTIWECRIKIFDDTFVYGGTNTPVSLATGKLMGFSLAYCDNDAGTTREGFIGSGVVPGTDKNVGYKTADYFQELQLLDEPLSRFSPNDTVSTINVYPNPANVYSSIYIEMENDSVEKTWITVCDLNGKVVYKTDSMGNKITTVQLDSSVVKSGVYLLSITNAKESVTKKIIIKE